MGAGCDLCRVTKPAARGVKPHFCGTQGFFPDPVSGVGTAAVVGLAPHTGCTAREPRCSGSGLFEFTSQLIKCTGKNKKSVCTDREKSVALYP